MRKLLFFIVVFCPLLSFAQKEGQARIDSLLVVLPKLKEDTLKVNTLNDLSTLYRYFDCEIGLRYGQQASILSKKLQWKYGIAGSYNAIGVNYIVMSDFEKAQIALKSALKISKNKRLTSVVLKNLGIVSTSQGDYAKGLAFCFQALKISERIVDKKEIANIFSIVGSTYLYLDKVPEAIAYHEKSLKINEQLGLKMNMASNLLNISHCYFKLNQNKKAIDYCKRSLRINLTLGNKKGTVNNFSSLAAIYLRLKEYQQTLDYSQKSLLLAKEINNSNYIAQNAGIISDVYLELAKKSHDKIERKTMLDSSENYCIKALHIDKETNNLLELSDNYLTLSEVEELQGNYKNALDSYKKSTFYKDSIFNADNKETIKNLEDKRTIELRDKEIKINKLTFETKEKQKWFLISALTFLGIIGGLLFYQSRNRKKVNEKLLLLNTELDQSNKTKTRFFSILNHDLRSPVANLIHFLHLQKENPELLDEESKKRMENKTIAGAENLLNSMEDILLWSKGQMNNFKPQPKNIAVHAIFADTQKHFESEEKVKITFENPNNVSLTTDENYLKTIIRNLTGNAIIVLNKVDPNNSELTKKNPTIIWKAWRENNQTFLSITDNGLGATQEQFRALYDENEVVGIKTGLGLHLIRDLAKAIGCEINVDSKVNEGTTFILKL